MTDEARLRALSNLASTVKPRGSGAAMSPFPYNPSPWLHSLPPAWSSPSVRCQLQSQRFLKRPKGFYYRGNQDSLVVIPVKQYNELKKTPLLLCIIFSSLI